MYDGMDEEEVPKKKEEVFEGPLLTERDRQKIERRKRKDERQREVISSCLFASAYVLYAKM
jgi:ATP-binding cassette, subfamily F, member 3